MNPKIEKELIKLIKIAYKHDEVPVAAIIEKDGQIVAKAYNNRKNTTNPLNHAEIRCIIKAAKRLKDWRITDCNLFVTLEPCHMCKEIIKETRIKEVFYYLPSEKKINYKTNFVHLKTSNNPIFKKLLTSFFENKRK